MNALKYLVFLLTLLLACHKEEPDTFRVLGIVRDANTKAPISGVTMTAYTSGGGFENAWNGTLYVVVNGSEKTDTTGKFDFEFIPTSKTIYLGISNIPADYKSTADLNGAPGDLLLDLDDFYANSQAVDIDDAVFYAIDLYPK